MLTEKMETALNDQVAAELFSGYLYLAMSADFAAKNLMGMAHWMNVQAKEELIHSMKFYYYILERGGRAKLAALEAPQVEWATPVEAFKAALDHERYITGRINNLMVLAQEEKDFATASMLQWYVDEQVEEEANAEQNVAKTEMVQGNMAGTYMIDKEFGARPVPFVLPVAEAPVAGG